MDVTGDDLAGVVDLFGALTRAELADALAELAFKAGEDHDPGAFEPAIDDALRTYHLVSVDTDTLEGYEDGGDGTAGGGDGTARGGGEFQGGNEGLGERLDDVDVASEALLVPGPVAFPQLPEGATDLPHILDVEERQVERELAGRAAEERFRSDAASAVESGDSDRISDLLDVSYELEVWAPVDLDAARGRLDDALEE